MIIMGIDPGYGLVGYGFIEKLNNGVRVIDYGVIDTPQKETTTVRLAIIYNAINELIHKYKPDEIALEELYFVKNISTGIKVAEARGVIELACIQNTGRLYEYGPRQVKQAITGIGNAKKTMVEEMVKNILGIKTKIKPDDASDALAIALTHAFTNKNFVETFGIK